MFERVKKKKRCNAEVKTKGYKKSIKVKIIIIKILAKQQPCAHFSLVADWLAPPFWKKILAWGQCTVSSSLVADHTGLYIIFLYTHPFPALYIVYSEHHMHIAIYIFFKIYLGAHNQWKT